MSERMKALGIHVFAGGFTLGVDKVMDVNTHLEVHDLGYETSTKALGKDVIRCDAKSWPAPPKDHLLAYGNPRCTAFSCVTGGNDRESHGAYAKQTRDAVELCDYAAGNFDFVVWESVQQAYSTGRELLADLYRDFFKPRGYRLCHLFINAASFGNAQNRKRYFFVAYRDNYKFNIQPPQMWPYRPALWDALKPFMDTPTVPQDGHDGDLGPNTSYYTNPSEAEFISHLPNGWGMNSMALHMRNKLSPKYQSIWDERNSDLPFSLFCTTRLSMTKFAPTLFTGSRGYLHPCFDRGLTPNEFGSIMGWPAGVLPVGNNVVQQLAKGICPDIGEWIAQQVLLSANKHWGSDDWESTYCPKVKKWFGGNATGKDEKVIDLTRWYPHVQDWSRFPSEILRPRYPVPADVEVYGVLNNRDPMAHN